MEMGRRVGKHRSDRRWLSDEGVIFASRYEYLVYRGLVNILGEDRVQHSSDRKDCTFPYTTEVKGGRCVECGNASVVQDRTYTPDVYAMRRTKGACYLETKGHFPPTKRSLIRSFVKTGPGIPLVIILQRDGKATTKRKLTEYIESYMKIPVFVWDAEKKPDNPPEGLLEYLNE